MKSIKPSFVSAKEQIDDLMEDQLIRLGIRLIFVLLGILIILYALGLIWLPPEVPLLYSRPYGEEQLIKTGWLIIVPGGALLFSGVSLQTASRVKEKEKLLTQMLIWVSVVIELMGLMTLIKIFWLVK